jgi:hypothetical protein
MSVRPFGLYETNLHYTEIDRRGGAEGVLTIGAIGVSNQQSIPSLVRDFSDKLRKPVVP